METISAAFVVNCKHCEGHDHWDQRHEFLADPTISLIAFRPDLDDPLNGRLIFLHDTCGAELRLPIILFLDLYQGVRYDQLRYGKPDCNKHCLTETDLSRCNNRCSMASLREVLAVISGWEKGSIT